MKIALYIFYTSTLILTSFSCSEHGLSDKDIPLASRNAKLNVTVEYCDASGCSPISGKIVNIYQYEDEAMGTDQGLQLKFTDTSGIARFGFIELPNVYVSVRNNGILDISQVNLPKNSISHHLITFSM